MSRSAPRAAQAVNSSVPATTAETVLLCVMVGPSGDEWRSGSGMGFAVAVLQPLGRHVGVDLGGRQVLVAEQLLDAPDVGPGVQHVRGERVPQGVRRRPRVES